MDKKHWGLEFTWEYRHYFFHYDRVYDLCESIPDLILKERCSGIVYADCNYYE